MSQLEHDGQADHRMRTPHVVVSLARQGPYSVWGRIKTHLWNFVLPPQIRLHNPPKEKDR